MEEIRNFIKLFKTTRDQHSSKNFDEIADIVFRKRPETKIFLLDKHELLECADSPVASKKALHKIKRVWKKVVPLNPVSKFLEICDRNDVVILERIQSTKKIHFTSTLYSNIKSGILLLFLKKLMGIDIDKALSESLDFNSLIRLSLCVGGKKIEIPTYDKVEHLLASAHYSYLVLIERMGKSRAQEIVKKELGVKINKDVLSKNLSKLSLVYAKEVNTENSDIHNMLKKSLRLVSTLQKKLEESLDKINDSEQLLKVYNDINLSFLTLTKALYKVSE